ncbi:MAG TPA: DDE-type integrase/transposase/recombinase [Sandaracinaceae bacterium LLY-WYZ-13_1]|nr:DDE-type integrase/transposase/recombinase [Sandaracinaceae bacterium LLY-WYZ-13_1]
MLRGHGYEPVRAHGRPVGPQPVRFEAPHRNALWQLDFCELRVGAERHHLLLVLDDFSRFCVGYRLCDGPSAEAVIKAMQEAIGRHGKPEAVRTDRGGGFLSKELGAYLEAELIDHVVGRAYHPQGGGKVESLVGTVKRELWEVEHFDDWETASRRLASFVADYNERRAHMGISELTPADRFFGRADRVLAHIDAVSRRCHGALAMRAEDGSPLEELREHALEVLRLVIVDGRTELRFCGSRDPGFRHALNERQRASHGTGKASKPNRTAEARCRLRTFARPRQVPFSLSCAWPSSSASDPAGLRRRSERPLATSASAPSASAGCARARSSRSSRSSRG